MREDERLDTRRRGGLLGRLVRRAAHGAFEGAAQALDADRMLQRSMATCIEVASHRYPYDPGAQWRPGEPLRLLLAGYTGTRNTGADVRVEEMIRQFRHLFGDEHLELSVLSIDPEASRGYFRTVRQLHLPQIYPRFLLDAVHTQHGVIACEGSMFKSKFANALSTMMVGALGLATAEHKIAVGYGGEAGAMDASLERLVRRYCAEALIIARNEQSRQVLAELGIRSEPGTDTAWTFAPAPDAVGRGLLERAGWDGRTPVLALCPINPFWWPVRPDLLRGASHAVGGGHGDSHYASVYFHRWDDDVEEAQARYIDALAQAVRRFADTHSVFPVCVGMERLDRRACESLASALGGAPVFVSDDHDMYAMVSLLRQSRMLLSSRYHAIVTSMPGGVASAGVTMDERIRNLMADRGQPELALEVDDPDLADRAYDVLRRLHDDTDAVRDGIDRCVVANLEQMGRMGRILVDHVRGRHPELEVRPGLGEGGDPWDHLPPLPPEVAALVERTGGA
ncbi:MAG: polysaccharide pyruvyl transferase family protein [Myxococcota bacterium]